MGYRTQADRNTEARLERLIDEVEGMVVKATTNPTAERDWHCLMIALRSYVQSEIRQAMVEAAL